MTPQQAANTLAQVLVQYERAMLELGWTWVNVNPRAALKVLEDAVNERDTYKHRWECADSPLMRVVMADRDAAAARADTLTQAITAADQLASVAHDAIWRDEVAPCMWLHDNDLPESAQSAIWRIHELLRPLAASSVRAPHCRSVRHG